MASADIIKITLRAKDEASKAIKSVNNAFLSTAKIVAGAGAAITGMAGGAVIALKPAISAAANFEKAFANVSTLVDTSKTDIDKLKNEILKLDPALGSATELTEGLYQALSAGVEPAKSVEFIGTAAKFAKAGLTDTKTAVDGLTSVMNAYGIEASKAGDVSDAFFKTVELGKTTAGELAASIGKIIPVTASLDVPISEVNASIATLTKGGLSTAESVTALKAALSNVLKPTSEAAKVAKELGIQFDSNFLKTQGLTGLLGQLSNTSGLTSEKLNKLFGSTEAVTAITALSGKQYTEFLKINKEIQNSIGATDTAFEKQRSTFASSMEVFTNSFEKLKIEVGSKLLPVLTPYLDKLSNIIQKNQEIIASKISVWFGYLADFVGHAANAAKNMLAEWDKLKQSKIFQIIGDAITNLANGMLSASKEILSASKHILNSILGVNTSIKEKMSDFFSSGKDIIVSISEGIVKALNPWLEKSIKITADIIESLFNDIKKNGIQYLQSGKSIIINLSEGITKAVKTSLDLATDLTIEALDNVLKWMKKNDSLFKASGSEIITLLITGISIRLKMLKAIVGNILENFGELLKWALENRQQLINTGKDIVVSLANGIIDAADTALTETITGVIDLIEGILDWIWDNRSLLFDAGKEIIFAIGDGIVSVGSHLYDKMADALSAVKNLLPQSPPKEGPLAGNVLPNAGKGIVSLIGNGIDSESEAGSIRTPMANAAQDSMTTFNSTVSKQSDATSAAFSSTIGASLLSAGQANLPTISAFSNDFMGHMANGVRSNQDFYAQAISDVLVNALNQVLGTEIASPQFYTGQRANTGNVFADTALAVGNVISQNPEIRNSISEAMRDVLDVPEDQAEGGQSIGTGLGGIIGTALGSYFGGPAGGAVGQIIGNLFGGAIGIFTEETLENYQDVATTQEGARRVFETIALNAIGLLDPVLQEGIIQDWIDLGEGTSEFIHNLARIGGIGNIFDVLEGDVDDFGDVIESILDPFDIFKMSAETGKTNAIVSGNFPAITINITNDFSNAEINKEIDVEEIGSVMASIIESKIQDFLVTA